MKTTKNKIVYEENINNIKGKASSIVFPETMQELKTLVKISEEDIIARGSGSSFTGGVIPQNSVIVDFSKMNRILEINASRRIAVVEPGVLLSELNEELEEQGLEFPVNPIFGGIETIGGMIGKNSSGNHEIKYGRMISWIDSLEVINSRGEQVRVSKSDLSDFVGMEGTTGLIIQATLRLTGKKPRSLTILKANTLEDVFIANRKLRLKQDIVSIDLLSKEISSMMGLDNRYHIFIESENEEGTFKAENYEKYLKIKSQAYKKAALEGFIYMSNVKLLTDNLQDFLMYLEENKIPYFGHLASGVIYPVFKPEQIESMNAVLRFAKKLRGRIAYNFGVGLTKKDALEFSDLDLLKRVKLRQDPECKFNRNKLIEEKLLHKKSAVREDKMENSETEKKEEMQTADYEDKDVAEVQTFKRPQPELTPEEKEKIKKIAGGFFSGSKKTEKNIIDNNQKEETK